MSQFDNAIIFPNIVALSHSLIQNTLYVFRNKKVLCVFHPPTPSKWGNFRGYISPFGRGWGEENISKSYF